MALVVRGTKMNPSDSPVRMFGQTTLEGAIWRSRLPSAYVE
jgi:hypothetical protein